MGSDVKVKEYTTSDIYFSAYLASIDIPLQGAERTAAGNGIRVVFRFRITDGDLTKAKSLYFGGTGSVKARKFVDNLKSLKALCFV